MRFTTAWAKVSNLNLTLKVALASLSFGFFVLTILTIKLALKDPLIIERECFSSTQKIAPSSHSVQELESFVQEAIKSRFNTRENPNPALLSAEELRSRLTEQKELGSRQMMQTVVVNEVKIEGDSVSVDSDRIISVSGIRSAFPFQLKLKLGRQTRNKANPYGLVLQKVDSTQAPGDAKEAK